MDDKFKHLLISSFLMICVLLIIVVIIAFNKKHSNKDLEPKDENKLVNIEILDEKQELAYNSISTANKYYGFYYGNKITIDDISNERMIKFAITNYILEKSMEIKGDLTCFINTETNSFKAGDVKNPECNSVIKIAKDTIDNYIVSNFNNERVFEPSNTLELLPLDNNIGYIYDGKGTYYIGNTTTGDSIEKLHTKYLRAEKDNDFLYIYDKAFVCDSLESLKAECRKGFEIEDVVFSKDYKKGETNISEVTNDEYNIEFITNSYDTLIDTYKHTFKIIEENYYWVSSEVFN